MSTVVDEYGFGVTWTLSDELMARTSHALVADGRVWFVDAVDDEEGVARALALGEPAGVLQLLDRHPRDCEVLAERFGVPHLRLPDAVGDAPFELFDVVDVPRWREKGLWWPEHRALLVPEALGTIPYFRVAAKQAGIHPFLRLLPPGAPRRYAPEHLLVGHGENIHGPGAATAVDEAYHRARRDIPRLPLAMLKAGR
jgi:hypothetical protein